MWSSFPFFNHIFQRPKKTFNLTNWLKKNWPLVITTLWGLGLYIFFLTQQIVLPFLDLGRHLTTGREILAGHWEVLHTNYYSANQADFLAPNHHWLTGVFFYLVYQLGDFSGLSVMMIVICGGIWLGYLAYLRRLSQSTLISSTLALISVLGFGQRIEIRPEIFGWLGILIFLITLHQFPRQTQISPRQWLLLLITQLLWVNFHISFIFGLFLVGLTIAAQIMTATLHLPPGPPKLKLKPQVWLLGCLTLVSLINPNGWRGLIQPLTMITNYEYPVAENQSLLALYQGTSLPLILVYCLLAGWWLILAVQPAIRTRLPLADHLLAITGLTMGWIALRNFPQFLLFVCPWLAQAGGIIKQQLSQKWQFPLTPSTWIGGWLIFATALTLIVVSGSWRSYFNLATRRLGLAPDQNQAIDYFKTHQLTGPIFNNYDIGGYLIFHLFPQTKVFTDNRPEAYPPGFFSQIYIPMQENNEIWAQMLAKYQFQTIIFGVTDLTSWGKNFLANRRQDPAWKIVFEDQIIIIFVRQPASS